MKGVWVEWKPAFSWPAAGLGMFLRNKAVMQKESYSLLSLDDRWAEASGGGAEAGDSGYPTLNDRLWL